MNKIKSAVYLGRIPKSLIITDFFCEERNAQIKSADSEKVKWQRLWSWKILLYAIKELFGLDEGELEFSLSKSGKWTCDKCCFSISHSNGVVAVAVSEKAVGVDIEDYCSFENTHTMEQVEKLAKRAKISINDDVSPYFSFLKGWVLKESAYKVSPNAPFIPADVEIDPQSEFKVLEAFDKTLFLAFSGEKMENLVLLDENLEKILN